MKTESAKTVFSDQDLQRFLDGNHDDIYNLLGAHPRDLEGASGINFAVWAPNAKMVCVVGDFNNWEQAADQMRPVGSSGIWETFVPAANTGQIYRYRITDENGTVHEKSDPFGYFGEVPPRSASIVCDLKNYPWQDSHWIEQRAQGDPLEKPLSIYEVHLGSWRQRQENLNGWLDYRTLAHELVDYCKQTGFTHLELMPISEHPLTKSWGYQTTGYFAVTSRYGTPEDFMYFVDHCHRNGIGVIIDWVPAHFPKDAHGLAKFDGTALYEHADPRQGEHPDWGTLIFNYGRNEVRNFLISNALFWFDKYHIDGIRVDAVASMLYLDYSREEGQWIPNKYGGRENLEAIDFLRQLNEKVHADYPGTLTIAEESTAWAGVSRPTYADGLGFSMKWNMGWMNDSLRYMRMEPVHRKFHQEDLTFSLVYAFTENFVLPLSHDEVVHGKRSLLDQMPGDQWQKFANLRLLYTYMWTHPGKNLLFMSGEFGQWDEWREDESIQWDLLKGEPHQGLQRLIGDLNKIMQENPALYELDFTADGFEWVSCDDAESSVIAYLRKGRDPADQLLMVCNFTPEPREQYVVGAPGAGKYREIFNSDSEFYGGSNVGNQGLTSATKETANGRDWRLTLTLPPLGCVVLRKED